MLFSRKGKLKKEFDEQLISQFIDVKQTLKKAQMLESLSADYDLHLAAECKIAESKHLFLLREARVRKVKIQ
ncbi:YaaL family protein [Planococcus sp. YIM B11945]|uniref:YaaL family protein n=1 Tax=Planococcus sp. YIM B11945 TaxID=3435410 RepID=UPI003D7CE616